MLHNVLKYLLILIFIYLCISYFLEILSCTVCDNGDDNDVDDDDDCWQCRVPMTAPLEAPV